MKKKFLESLTMSLKEESKLQSNKWFFVFYHAGYHRDLFLSTTAVYDATIYKCYQKNENHENQRKYHIAHKSVECRRNLE